MKATFSAAPPASPQTSPDAVLESAFNALPFAPTGNLIFADPL